MGSRAPITLRSIFHLASVTKPLVATAVMQLVDEGKVDLNAPVIRYLPYFKMNDPRARSTRRVPCNLRVFRVSVVRFCRTSNADPSGRLEHEHLSTVQA